MSDITPEQRKALFMKAFVEAMLEVDCEDIAVMMAGKGWKWYDAKTQSYYPPDAFDVRRTLHGLWSWVDCIDFTKPASFAGNYTGGFFLASQEFPAGEDEDGPYPLTIRVTIVFGLCSEGEAEHA